MFVPHTQPEEQFVSGMKPDIRMLDRQVSLDQLQKKRYFINVEIQWGFENQTCPDFEWLKLVRSLNDPVFKLQWGSEYRTFENRIHSKTRHFNVRF